MRRRLSPADCDKIFPLPTPGAHMSFQPILMPMLVMVLLTFIVWVYMYVLRLSEISHKSIDPQDLRDRNQAQQLLTDSANPSNNLKNLFEMPVLFYLAVMLSLVLLIQDRLLVQLAWGYVALRILHSVVHCSYNRVVHRFTAYALSCLFLLLIWIRLASWILLH
jgi:hypothetical protein